MIGNLTIDKASMNISYFLNTVRLISVNNGKISRADFVQQMAEFIGVPAKKNGKENRTPYNKSKLPRYFGFVDIDVAADGTNYLVLTHRGNQLAEFIGENKDADASQRFFILPERREAFIDLIFESVIFGSFGKNNCGAEQSNTDVEPPKVVFKTLLELERATAEEICYVMFGLNRGEFQTFDEAIAKIKANRSVFQYDYAQIMEQWEVTNIVHDCKIINIFTEDSIQLLRSERDEEIGKVFYYLNNTLSAYHRDQIATMSAIYQPLKLFVYTDGNGPTVQEWVNTAILGGVSDNSYVYRYDGTAPFLGSTANGSFSPGIFEQALLKALQNAKKNIYLLIENTTEPEFVRLFGDYYSLLHRIDNLSSEKHGWSEQAIDASSIYQYLVSSAPSIRGKLQYGKLEIPSNLQIVGTIIMENINGNEQFDYEFTRCLVRTGSASETPVTTDESTRLTGGVNILLYGVPGSGKSWTIEHEYCKPGTIVERLVFHPDYTNADFVGQILPVVDPVDKQVTYEFTPGPFTNILREAYIHPQKKYILIIEEINRGNAPAIFGDVFQLLDRTVAAKISEGITYPAGTSEYGITNSNVAKAVYGDEAHKVRIPSNLSILGTMNTSDQNVFTLDTAFQRRWRMRLIENTFFNVRTSLAQAEILDTGVTWRRFCETINEIIIGNKAKMASAEDKRLGVYFVHENDLKFDDRAKAKAPHTNFASEYNELLKAEIMNGTPEEATRLAEVREALMQIRIFPEKVIKYLWDDAFKFNPEALFDTDNMDSLERVIRTFVLSQGHERFKIFRSSVQQKLYPTQQ